MVTPAVALLALSKPMPGALGESWTGDFTITIAGAGNASGPGPSAGKWTISREARGTIVLDKMFRGAGIARTPDSKNTDRYETWIASSKRSIEMRIHDLITVRGPLFAKDQFRFDTRRYDCPIHADPPTWQVGTLGSAILQFDSQTGTFAFEMPRFFARAQTYFKREFVAGPRVWTSNKPIVDEAEEIEFEIIHGLVQPSEWFKLTGPFKPGQTEVVLSRKFTFAPPLGASIRPQRLPAELSLKMRRQ